MPGWRQKLALDRERSRSPRSGLDIESSSLATSLVRDWCFGKLSSPAVKAHALADVKDQGSTTLPAMRRLSQIGGDGSDTRNCNRALMNQLKGLRVMQLIEAIPRSQVTHMIPPHSLIGTLSKHQRVFEKVLGAVPASVEQFWTNLHSSAEGRHLFEEHKQLIGKTPADLRHTLPLTIHQDAGPYAKHRSVEEVSWSSCLGKGSEIECKFISFTFLKERKAEAMQREPNRAWSRFIDSVTLMEEGVHSPGSTLANEPIALDSHGVVWKAIVLFGKADGEQAIAWGLKSHADPDEMCGYCLANRSSRPYTCLREDASWQTTEIGNTIAFASRLRRPHHPLVDAIFFTFWFVRLEIMHLLDCKGVWSILAGSVLWLLVHREARLGGSIDARLKIINQKKQKWYTDHAVCNRMPNIKEHNILTSDWAELGGPAIKAANTRSLLPFIGALAVEFFDSGSIYHKSIKKVLGAANEMVNILYSSDMFLLDAQKQAFRTQVATFGKHFQLCQSIASADGTPLWHLTPKVHQTLHLPRQCELINSRFVQAYAEESLVGVIAKIWHASAHGGYMTKVQHTVCVKYLVGLNLKLETQLE